jgi:uncharacterized protein YggE
MKKFLASLFLPLAACTLLAAQDQGNVPLQQNAVIVGADGEFESAPDAAIINFVISAQESDSQAAFARAGRAADRVREVLRTNGIDPKTAELSQYNLEPEFDYKSSKRRIVGYTVSSTVTIKLKDFKKIPPLLQGFATIQETENQSFSYSLEQIEDAKSKAVQNAYQRARIYAQSLAQASSRTLGEMISANVEIREGSRILPMMARSNATRAEVAVGPTEQFGEQKIKVTAHVIASFVLK